MFLDALLALLCCLLLGVLEQRILHRGGIMALAGDHGLSRGSWLEQGPPEKGRDRGRFAWLMDQVRSDYHCCIWF